MEVPIPLIVFTGTDKERKNIISATYKKYWKLKTL